MVMRAPGFAALFVLSCSRPTTAAATAPGDGGIAIYTLAGAWKADLSLYEGSATLTATGPDAYEIVVEGKGRQRGQAHRDAKTRQLRIDLAADSYRCTASADYRALTCSDAKGQTLGLVRPSAASTASHCDNAHVGASRSQARFTCCARGC
jgi:hypothetical protein